MVRGEVEKLLGSMPKVEEKKEGVSKLPIKVDVVSEGKIQIDPRKMTGERGKVTVTTYENKPPNYAFEGTVVGHDIGLIISRIRRQYRAWQNTKMKGV